VEPAASKDSSSLNPPFIPRGAILYQVAALTRERDALALAETLRQKKYRIRRDARRQPLLPRAGRPLS
jgi:hypothetical protein